MNLNHYQLKKILRLIPVQIAIHSLLVNNGLHKHKVELRNLTENMELNKGNPLFFSSK